MCHCGAVVKWLLERADKSDSTPGEAVFCFFVPFFFSVWSLFANEATELRSEVASEVDL